MNPRPPKTMSQAELAAYDRTCERLSGFDDGLDFETVDGFLASLAALPHPPEPAQWLPALCGDAWERTFGDPEDQAQAQASLQARLAVLRSQLDPEALLEDPDRLRLDPFIGEVTDEDRQRMVDEHGATPEEAATHRTGAYWAEGFLRGVASFESLWQVPQDDEAPALFAQAFAQIEALLAVPDSDEWKSHLATYYPKGDPTRDELIGEACMAVQDLRLFWVDFAPVTETRRVAPAPGRNDPCPCGSGKKYKKCHGA